MFDNPHLVPAVCKDGSTLRVRLSVSPLRLEGRDLLVGTASPAGPELVVSAEASLSAAFYQTIVERAPILISVATGGQFERWVSPATRRLLGAQPGESLAGALARLAHPDDFQETYRKVSEPGSLAEPHEMRLRGLDGAWHVVSIIAADLRDDPAVNGVVFYGIDATRARIAEERERARTARLFALLGSLAAGVLAVDEERRIVLANPALVEMLGLGVPPGMLDGATLAALPPAGVDPSGWAALHRVTAGGTGVRELTLPMGQVVEIVSTDITVNGGSLGKLWVLHDVTASVAARRVLEEHNRQLAALSALKSEFIAIVSHELRTPLTSISSFTEMLGGPGELTSPDAPEAVAAIARNTDRMLILVQDLRLLSQLETGDQAVASGAVDMADLAREVGDGIDTGGRVIVVRSDITDGPLLDGDEQLLRQLVHAVTGTVAACAAGDEMRLRAAADETGWTLCATAPSGEFVTDEQLLATPLPVLDDASRQRSAALSVLLARAIAQSHGGSMITEVHPGSTATITVRLPLTGPRGLTSAPD